MLSPKKEKKRRKKKHIECSYYDFFFLSNLVLATRGWIQVYPKSERQISNPKKSDTRVLPTMTRQQMWADDDDDVVLFIGDMNENLSW